MDEYIGREAAIEYARLLYCKDCNSYNGVRCRACAFDDVILLIEEAPTADVVEVVRCKDCKHRYVPTRCALWYAQVDDTEYFVERGDDFYCSYGEAKMDGRVRVNENCRKRSNR